MPHVVPPKDPPIECVLDLAKLIRSGEIFEKQDWAFIHGYAIFGYAGRLQFGVPPEVDFGGSSDSNASPRRDEAIAACEALKAAIVETVPHGAESGSLPGLWKYLYEKVLPLVLEWLDRLQGEQAPA